MNLEVDNSTHNLSYGFNGLSIYWWLSNLHFCLKHIFLTLYLCAHLPAVQLPLDDFYAPSTRHVSDCIYHPPPKLGPSSSSVNGVLSIQLSWYYSWLLLHLHHFSTSNYLSSYVDSASVIALKSTSLWPPCYHLFKATFISSSDHSSGLFTSHSISNLPPLNPFSTFQSDLLKTQILSFHFPA